MRDIRQIRNSSRSFRERIGSFKVKLIVNGKIAVDKLVLGS